MLYNAALGGVQLVETPVAKSIVVDYPWISGTKERHIYTAFIQDIM